MKHLIQCIKNIEEKVLNINNIIDTNSNQNRIDEIDHLISNPAIWNDQRKASLLVKERKELEDLNSKIKYFNEQLAFYKECAELMPDDLPSLSDHLLSIEKDILQFEFSKMLSEPEDNAPAILTINAGAGGLEAANWTSMLLRMYYRFAESKGFKIEELDMDRSEDHSSICIDSVSIRIEGKYAFGFFKGENGIHRLIRNSPFNSGDARHTSCAAVAVIPDIEDTIDIKIDEKDLEITAQTAGGPGGQHSNKVSSAIRLRHVPSGITIFVRAERDQHANRRIAMKMLKAKLYDIELKKKEAEREKHLSTMKSNSFGSQIRTYTINPYSLVKDHRTDFESRDVDGVLDGDIEEFVMQYLLGRNKKETVK
jgi:peptide chain release factor 2